MRVMRRVTILSLFFHSTQLFFFIHIYPSSEKIVLSLFFITIALPLLDRTNFSVIDGSAQPPARLLMSHHDIFISQPILFLSLSIANFICVQSRVIVATIFPQENRIVRLYTKYRNECERSPESVNRCTQGKVTFKC